MKINSVFLKDISLRVKILQSESKKEIQDEISSIMPLLTETQYIAWVLDTFVVSINRIYEFIFDSSSGDPGFAAKTRDTLYKEVLKLNPLLNPNNIYITQSNTLSLYKDKIKLVDCPPWHSDQEGNSFLLFNVAEYSKIVEKIRGIDHYIEMSPWELVPEVLISVRKFSKGDKTVILHGYTPKTEDDVKLFVVSACIDNFHELYQYLSNDPGLSSIPFNKIVYSLYEIAITNNNFLNLKQKDFDKVNKNFKVFKEGKSEGVDKDQEKQLRKSLQEVPRREILGLETFLNRRIFGQEEAIAAVCKTVKRAYLGIKDQNTPLGAFFFYGGTSTGKTELAKEIARALTKAKSGLVKIACNTLISSHNVHTLIGAPPGYIGYDDESILKKALSNSSFKVILFDEIEKAHPKLMDMLLDVLEDGELLLANGEMLDLSNCLFIFTSNIGQQEAVQSTKQTGFGIKTATEVAKVEALQYHNKLQEKLKPEFLARLNGKFYFKNLSEDDFVKLAQSKIGKYQKSLTSKNIFASFSSDLPSWVVKQCKTVNKNFHARNIRNFIENGILEKLGDFIVGTELNLKQTTIKVSLENDIIRFHAEKKRLKKQ